MKYKFEVKGKVQVKQRPRIGKGGHVYTPKATKDYEQLIYWEAKAAGVKMNEGLVRLTLKFFLKSLLKADLDNMIKSVSDGLNGVAYKDDRQVVTIHAQKLPGKHESVEITVEDE